jgi:thiol:disulfide interchange protein/DsbC/DsbD-like thiol-disulfide interchange protein
MRHPFSFCTLIAILFIALLSISTGANAQNSFKSIVISEQIRAELMAYAPQGVTPGQPVWVGLQLNHQPHWHTYWKNAGDSGLPTTLEWKLPPGVSAGEIAWPAPHKIPIGNMANYGYEGSILLPVPLTISPDFKPPLLSSALDINLKATWLVCRQECIPQEGEFAFKLPIKSTTALNGATFEASFNAQPKPLTHGADHSTIEVTGQQLHVRMLGLPAVLQGKTLDFFPETADIIDTAAPWTQTWAGTTWTASIPLSPQRSLSPSLMPVVVGLAGNHWRSESPISGSWPTTTNPSTTVTPALEAALKANTNAAPIPPTLPLSLGLALLGALLGGLILNLMPCVFPVLAIKVLSFTQSNSTPNAKATLRTQGLAYTTGVIASFVLLGGLLLALRAGGEQLGWGFQLQSPVLVAGLAVLFTVIALNLFGLFEIGMLLPSRAATAQARNPTLNSFLSGVLAVAIASPCTAPFMGASLGLAVALPAGQALLVFATIGLGMALPYLAASLTPAVARLLPRPGAWMDVFKKFMAFPMLATVAWLLWVLGQQTSIDGVAALLLLLLLISMGLWSLGLAGRSRVIIATISIAMFIMFSGAIGKNIFYSEPKTATPTEAMTGNADHALGTQPHWQAWQPGRVEQLQAQGKTVFVDFTAAWCVTCQFNKRTTLSHPQVLADLAAKDITLLRADWTRRDPAIAAALAALGRNGVPVYVFYKPGQAPRVLSEVITVDEIRNALANP